MNNDKHNKVKTRLKIIGFIVLAIGLACTVTGMVDFFTTAMNMKGMPKLFWLLFIGVPMLGIGGALLGFAFQREIMRYTKNEAVPALRARHWRAGTAQRKKGVSHYADQTGCPDHPYGGSG